METTIENARTLVLIIVLGLVDEGDAVKITPEMTNLGVTLHVSTSALDAGKVIGAGGRMARSIRSILAAHGKKTGTHFYLNIREGGK